jgi:hypothetical protein
MRDPELIFLEVESINMKDKVAQYWYVKISNDLFAAHARGLMARCYVV